MGMDMAAWATEAGAGAVATAVALLVAVATAAAATAGQAMPVHMRQVQLPGTLAGTLATPLPGLAATATAIRMPTHLHLRMERLRTDTAAGTVTVVARLAATAATVHTEAAVAAAAVAGTTPTLPAAAWCTAALQPTTVRLAAPRRQHRPIMGTEAAAEAGGADAAGAEATVATEAS